MANTKFKFDKKTGGLVAQTQQTEQTEQLINDTQTYPELKSNEQLDGEPIFKFRAQNDLTTYQVIDDETRKPMMTISGYALEIKFNLGELKTTEKIEQLLSGLTDMWRKLIVSQALQKQ